MLKCNVPDNVFSLLLTLNHNLWHLQYEGVGLRQMMDLYYVARSMQASDEVLRLLRRFKLESFASASAWVLWHLFDGCADNSLFISKQSPLPAPNERLGKFLLDEIMKAGNFGHHDDRLKSGCYVSTYVTMAMPYHTMRLVRYFPMEVAWTSLGILRISLWRWWRYRNETIKTKKL